MKDSLLLVFANKQDLKEGMRIPLSTPSHPSSPVANSLSP